MRTSDQIKWEENEAGSKVSKYSEASSLPDTIKPHYSTAFIDGCGASKHMISPRPEVGFECFPVTHNPDCPAKQAPELAVAGPVVQLSGWNIPSQGGANKTGRVTETFSGRSRATGLHNNPLGVCLKWDSQRQVALMVITITGTNCLRRPPLVVCHAGKPDRTRE